MIDKIHITYQYTPWHITPGLLVESAHIVIYIKHWDEGTLILCSLALLFLFKEFNQCVGREPFHILKASKNNVTLLQPVKKIHTAIALHEHLQASIYVEKSGKNI